MVHPSSHAAKPRVVIFAAEPGDRYRVGRTLRALQDLPVPIHEVLRTESAALAAALDSGPVWLLRAGAWPARRTGLQLPPASATGRPLCALGRVCALPQDVSAEEVQRWSALLGQTGGHFGPEAIDRLPSLPSVFLDAVLTPRVAQRLQAGQDLASALRAELGDARLVHYPPLDVQHDPALRVLQVVTSLQQGGAERIVLDLTTELERNQVHAQIVTLGRPTRLLYPVPAGTVDLSPLRGDRRARATAIAQLARTAGSDLVHAHLLDGTDMKLLAAQGLPLVGTVHNQQPGWPDGLTELGATDARLFFACAWAVEAELRQASIPVPIRTIWNGIDVAALQVTPASSAAGKKLRRDLGLAEQDFVLLALANPRPQKRLHLLPAILAATRAALGRHGSTRAARLVLAGAAGRGNAAAEQAVQDIHAEVARFGLQAHVCWTGSVDEIAPLVAAADVLVSTSAFEGLSLAQLEALAGGVPVVATAAGGIAELAAFHPRVTVLPLDAGPERFAQVLVDLARPTPSPLMAEGLPPSPLMGEGLPTPSPLTGEGWGGGGPLIHFTRARMAEQYARLYPRAIERGRSAGSGAGLWLVTNNFSTGGAQSSARRLLVALHRQGIPAHAAVLQEEPDEPTPGRRALQAAGVPVLALPPAGSIDAARAVALLLEQIDAARPRAVVFWNTLAEYKVLLADSLLDVPVFDVSPGEMYFTSLQRYFRKPRPGLPYRDGRDYGSRLAGAIVKFQAEAAQAAQVLGTAVHVIPNGIPLRPVPVPTRTPDRLVLGTLARISPQKKLDELLAALRLATPRLPPHVLRIAGGIEPGAEDHAQQLCQQTEGLAVEWLGDVQDTDDFLGGLDLFVLVAEPAGCPNASLEALAAGLPVVATDVGGMSEQLQDGVTGRLVPRAAPAALAAALIELAHDAALRARLAAAGRQHVADRFSLDRMVAHYCHVCRIV